VDRWVRLLEAPSDWDAVLQMEPKYLLDQRGSIVLTSDEVFNNWPEIFNDDSTLTSALLDRLLHHAETVLIEGKRYRMKDQIEA